MTRLDIKRLMRFVLPALGLVAGSAAGTELADGIFDADFDRVTFAARSIAFSNETTQRFDVLADSPKRFDAMWVDFNGDGCYDAWIYDHDNGASSRLWINRCDGSHRFRLASNDDVRYNQPGPNRGSGWVALADVNGDGRQDFWTRDADIMAAWYPNGTAGTSAGATPRFDGKRPACNNHCVLADINGDGSFEVVHRNRMVSTIEGRSLLPAEGSAGYRGAADIDGDGWVDLVQPSASGYWKNNRGALEWKAIPGLRGDTELMLMVDFDNDGHIDILTVGDGGTEKGARIWRNNGNGTFTDVTANSNLQNITRSRTYWTGYGNVMAADLDNDGLQDVIIAGDSFGRSDVAILRNLGGFRFERSNVDLGRAASGSEGSKARASVADFDNDGRLDILMTQTGTNVGLWRNTTDTGSNRWMKVRVRGQGLNSDGVGADVKWYAAGTQRLIAHMSVQVSNQHPQTWLHTGVGANERIDMVITWPHGGPVERYNGLATNQEVIAWPNGCLVQHWQPGKGWPLAPPSGCR